MRTPKRTALVLVMLAALAGAMALAVAPSGARTTKAQRFFTDALLEDAKVSELVRRNLRRRIWRVDRDVMFRDLNGDRRSDAVVRVYSGTTAQDIAIYVLGSRGSSKLRVIFMREGLYRVTVSTRRSLLRLVTPEFAKGDPTCCPGGYVERAYGWDGKGFKLRNTRRIDAG